MASYSRLRYHIVTATRKRRPLITSEVEEIIAAALYEKAVEIGGRIMAFGGTSNHVHIVVAFSPVLALSDAVRELKTASSRAVNRSRASREVFQWQPGYGVFTVSAMEMDALIQYVRNQKRHHARRNLRPKFERIPRPRESPKGGD